MIYQIFDYNGGNIFNLILEYLDQFDICNLKLVIKDNPTLLEKYNKLKEWLSVRAKMFIISKTILYCDDDYRYYFNKYAAQRIDNYFIADKKFIGRKNVVHNTENSKIIFSDFDDEIYYLNKVLDVLNRLEIKRGDIIRFESKNIEEYRYIYKGNNQFESVLNSLFIDALKLPDTFTLPEFNSNYWIDCLNKYEFIYEKKSLCKGFSTKMSGLYYYHEKIGCNIQL